MCIVIYNPSDAKNLSPDAFNKSNDANPDGMGMAWALDGEIKIMHTLLRCDLLYIKYLEIRKKGADVLLHFRKATHGKVSLENCHPFWLTDDVVFAHNGVIYLPGDNKDESDTLAFRDKILDKLPEKWWEDPYLFDLISDYIAGSKIVLMFPDGSSKIIRETGTGAHWFAGSWFSNSSYKYKAWKDNRKDNKKDNKKLPKHNDKRSGYSGGHPIACTCTSCDNKWSGSCDNKWSGRKELTGHSEKPEIYGYSEYLLCKRCVPETMIGNTVHLMDPQAVKEGGKYSCDSCAEYFEGLFSYNVYDEEGRILV
jgi:glutamine amidotransferase